MTYASPSHSYLAFAAAFLVGFSKTGITGFGILAVAIFAMVIPPKASTGALLPLLVFADCLAVISHRRHADWKQLARMLPWTVIGIGGGFVAMFWADDAIIKQFIGALLLLLVAWQVWWRRRVVSSPDAPDVPHAPAFAATMGILTGFATMVANAAGPIMSIYLLAMRLPKMAFVGTAAWFFLLVNTFKLPFSVHLDLITRDSLEWNLGMVPAVITGAIAGRWLLGHVNQKLFEILALALTFVAGVRLLI